MAWYFAVGHVMLIVIQINRVLSLAQPGFMSSVGGGFGASNNQGSIFLSLKPRGQRLTADEIVNELRPKLSGIPGLNILMQVPPAIQIVVTCTKRKTQPIAAALKVRSLRKGTLAERGAEWTHRLRATKGPNLVHRCDGRAGSEEPESAPEFSR